MSEQSPAGVATREAMRVRPRSRRYQGLREWLVALPYLAPTIIGLSVFSIGPILAALYFSFTDYNILKPPNWIGLANYASILTDQVSQKALINSLYYAVVSVPLGMALSLLIALAMNRKLKGMTFYRSLYFLPVVSSTVAVALVWSWIYNPQFGLLNYFLNAIFHIQGPAWLADTTWAMPALIIMSVWKGLGYNMVIFLAGLQGIPDEFHEAARVDGAGTWRRFVSITLPLLSPTVFFVLVVSLISSLQVFEQTYIMTQGGPGYATLTLGYWIFMNAFQFFHLGFASALAYVLFVVVLVMTLAQFRLQRLWVYYD
jgi:multiple sugar transport system permease protein